MTACQVTKSDVTGNTELPEPIRSLPKVTMVCIELQPGGEFRVDRFGLPFANPQHSSDGWINRNTPIIGGVDLLSLLRRRRLTLLVAKAPISVHFRAGEPDDVFRYPFAYPSPDTVGAASISLLGEVIEKAKVCV
jgi:hypothetical protein